MSSFTTKKLDILSMENNNKNMKTYNLHTSTSRQTAAVVRYRIEHGGERLWCFEDFTDQPFSAVAKALSRLAKDGMIVRLSKGTYYRARHTVFGTSQPNPSTLQKLASRGGLRLLPSGIAAANLLGFTTQNAKQVELATSSSSVPRKLIGKDTVVHTRRPEAWSGLNEIEAALLDFLRHGGKASELSPQATIEKTLSMLAKRGCFQRLVNVAKSEPPRVRAMLGALGEKLGKDSRTLNALRSSLNSLSRFDFGIYTALPTAQAWYAKRRH